MDRRELLKAVLAVPSIKTIEKIQPQKDEIFVISVDQRLSIKTVQRIYQQWGKVFEQAGLAVPPVMVLEEGMSLSVARVK